MTTTNKAGYPTRQLGKNGPFVSAIGFGAMGNWGAWYGSVERKEVFEVLTAAADRGVTFWDTSDFYGTSEKILGSWLAETGRRSEIFLATKFGVRDEWNPETGKAPISDPEYIVRRLENSLKDLQTDYIDLYYQHRVDPTVPIEAVLEALRPAVEKGTVKWIGLSECSVATLRRAKAVPGLGEKVIAAEMEYSPFETSIESNGIVDACRELGVGIVAYSPLARGLVTGRFRSRADFDAQDFRLHIPRFSEENFPKNLALVDKFQEIAAKLNATGAQVALAWILAAHPDFFPIPGSSKVSRLEDNAKGGLLKLPQEDVKAITEFVREASITGSRYPDEYLATPGMSGDCIPLSEWKGQA
ncbi:Aldo/keto reductase [Pterulicium gracile]|uniref:Aldo/keto reductase n=1 Tax=Pterulicium gracile TaxID=1884261 RepID=A0A5C3Q1W1_9AGAR|nr:Aldo/keto reductase [Pterula gracilis]